MKPGVAKQLKFKGNQVQNDFNLKLAKHKCDVVDLVNDGSVSRSGK